MSQSNTLTLFSALRESMDVRGSTSRETNGTNDLSWMMFLKVFRGAVEDGYYRTRYSVHLWQVRHEKLTYICHLQEGRTFVSHYAHRRDRIY
jgi:hypothetical protein